MDYSELDAHIDRITPTKVVEGLGPLLTRSRRERIERVVTARLQGLRVAVERPSDPYNAAAVVRSADSFGALHVHVVGAREGALHARKTTQGSFNWVHTHHHEDFEALQAALRAGEVQLAGGAMDGALRVEELPVDVPLCLLFGNETQGLSEHAYRACDMTFRVPMYGMSESLNLSVTAAISLYETARRRRAYLGRDSDLDDAAMMRERARYYARSTDLRALLAL